MNSNKIIVKNSVESLFRDSYISQETYKDQYKIEMEKAFDICESMEAIYSVYEYNLNTKLRMIEKINKTYGPCSKGIENYCRIQSLEADETSSGTTDSSSLSTSGDQSQNGNQNNTQVNPEVTKKKNELLQKVLETIKNLAIKIFQWIMDLINKFRYNNKVFEGTINTINNASEEDLNKVSDDLKNVEFDAKDLLVIAKHPQESINKHTGNYQLLCDVFNNAISAGLTNPKDVTKIKDFSSKLKNFIGSVPEIGNSCPVLEGDGVESLKQYTNALKTYSNDMLNYKKHMKVFNTFFGNTETLDGKTTVGKIMGNIDPKSIVNLIKTESDAIDKLNESLSKSNESTKKSTSEISNFIKKMMSAGSGDKQLVDANNNQLQCLLGIQKALIQINSAFCGICANSIKSINTCKGKLIEFVKKNVNTSEKKEGNNTTKNNENKTEETKEALYVDYQFESFMKSLEHLQDVQFTELYSIEDIDVYSSATKRSPLIVIKELFNKIWKALVNFIKTIITKVNEYWDSKAIDKLNKKENSAIVTFVRDSQILLRRMDATVTKVNKSVEIVETIVKNNGDNSNSTNNATSHFFGFVMSNMKLFVICEKVVYKTFTKFRTDVLKGNIKKVGNGSIERFCNEFNNIASQFNELVNMMVESARKDEDYTSSEVKVIENKFTDIIKKTGDLITNTIGEKITVHVSLGDNGRTTTYNINQCIDRVEQLLNTEKVYNYVGKNLFGIEIDKKSLI